jgi:hypothetical protein
VAGTWIEVKYYESGHSFMGGYGPDSTHATILKEGRKVVNKLVPEDWLRAGREAADGKLNIVDFSEKTMHRDWHTYLQQFYKVDTGVNGRKKLDINGESVNVTKFRAMRLSADRKGLVGGWSKIDGLCESVTMCIVKKKFELLVVDDVFHMCFHLLPNPLSYNQVKGIMAAHEFMPEGGVAQKYWEGRLRHQACIVRDEAGRSRKLKTFEALLKAVLKKSPTALAVLKKSPAALKKSPAAADVEESESDLTSDWAIG